MEVREADRLRRLEEENRKLKQLVAEQALDIVGIQGGAIKSGRSTGQARSRHGISGRSGLLGTACPWAAGSVTGYAALPSAGDALCRSQRSSARSIAGAGRRSTPLGYRRLHVFLRRERRAGNTKEGD